MHPQLKRFTAMVVLAAVTMLTVAPMAEAAPRIKRKYKGPRRETRVVYDDHVHYRTRRVVHHHDSGVAPFLAGVVGGLILGTQVGKAHAEPVRVVHVYHDPYCDTRYTSIDAYEDHLYRSHHPRVVRVLERDSGRCVATRHWHDRQWTDRDDCDRDGRHRDDGRYGDRHDDRYDDWYRDRDDDGYDDRDW